MAEQPELPGFEPFAEPAAETSRVPRWWLYVIGSVLGVLALVALVTIYVVVSSRSGVQDPALGPLPERADAVVAFGGDRSRHEHALELMDDGLAPVMVVSIGHQHPSLEPMCGQVEPFEVWCPDPAELNTRGDARMFGGLAREHGWETVVAVTSEYHVQRARTHLQRCYSGPLVFTAPSAGSVSDRIIQRETLGGIHARFFTRGC